MPSYWALTTPEQVFEYLDRCESSPLVGIDTETTGLDRWRDDVVGFSLAADKGEGVYVPLRHDRGPNVALGAIHARMAAFLRAGTFAMHSAPFDTVMLARTFDVAPFEMRVVHDTQLAAFCIGERREGGSDNSAGLKELAEKYLGVVRPHYEDLFPPSTKKKDRKFAALDLDIATPYAAADGDDVLGLVDALAPVLKANGVEFIYANVEMPLLPEVLRMEWRGVCIDRDYCTKMSLECEALARGIEARVLARFSERVGEPVAINLNSGPQLGEVLFDKLKLPVVKMTPPSKKFPEGNRSVDEEVLEKLAAYEPAVAWILEMRGVRKAKSTYFDSFPGHAFDSDDLLVLHPNYKQFGTETGRWSSSDPNVQNLSKPATFEIPDEVAA